MGIFLAIICWLVYLSCFAVILNQTSNETSNHNYIPISQNEDAEEEIIEEKQTGIGISINENYFPQQEVVTRE